MIETIQNKLRYEYDTEENCLTTIWDCDNEDIDKIMSNEFHYDLYDNEDQKSLMWVEKLKECVNWKDGEKLYIGTKRNCDGWFNCWAYRSMEEYKKEGKGFADMILEKNGYISMLCWNVGTYGFDFDKDDNDIKPYVYIRPWSVFNFINYDKLEMRKKELEMRTKEMRKIEIEFVVVEDE